MRFFKKFKAKQKRINSLPVHAVCRNCGARTQGPYCSQCGQNLFAGISKSIGAFIFNIFEHLFAFDGKILLTLKYLLFYPGKLTNEYIQGRIVRYVNPSKLFWFIILAFMLVAGIDISRNVKVSKQEKSLDARTKQKIADSITRRVLAESGVDGFAVEDENNIVKSKDSMIKTDNNNEDSSKNESLSHNHEFMQKLMSYAPYAILLLIPLFTFLLYVLFHKRYRYFTDHMVFALHFHSFLFLFFTCIFIVNLSGVSIPKPILKYILLLLPVYFATAIYRVYKPKIFALIWKTLFMITVYFIVVITVLVLFFLFLAWLIDEL
jgi:hypothetical protein